MDKNERMAEEILPLVGGKDNVISVFHCATRLRFELKDKSAPNEEALKKVDGVLGTKHAGNSFQVIVGPNVGQVYDALCEKNGLDKFDEVNAATADGVTAAEKADSSSDPMPKRVLNNVITYIMNSIAPIIPVLIGVSMWKTIGTLLGPSMFNVVAEGSDFITMCDFLFEALFYFLPVFIGYTAARYMKIEPVWGLFLGTLIITPTFVSLVGQVDTFFVFGVAVPVANYSQQFLPVLLGVWLCKYVLKGLNKVVPTMISGLLVPVITVGIMTFVMFAICAPIGGLIGNGISYVFMYFANAPLVVRVPVMMFLAAIGPLSVLFGVHVAIYVAALTAGAAVGYEAFYFPVFLVYCYVMYGMSPGAIFKFKKEDRGDATGYFVSGFCAGISEPSLYGVCLKSKSSIAVMCVSGAIGGFFAGIFQLKCALLSAVNVFSLIPYYTVDSTTNIILGVVVSLGSMLIAAAGTYLFANFDEK